QVGLRLSGVARRLHAGRAVERFDADAGVVRQRGQLREPARVPCLRQRVLDEACMWLVRLRDPELRLRDHFDAQWREQAAKLAQLSGIARGENEARETGPGPAAKPQGPPRSSSERFCSAISARMPPSASVMSVSISLREKATPSAVPWTSTKRPAPVMTTFMSVSQSASSS